MVHPENSSHVSFVIFWVSTSFEFHVRLVLRKHASFVEWQKPVPPLSRPSILVHSCDHTFFFFSSISTCFGMKKKKKKPGMVRLWIQTRLFDVAESDQKWNKALFLYISILKTLHSTWLKVSRLQQIIKNTNS